MSSNPCPKCGTARAELDAVCASCGWQPHAARRELPVQRTRPRMPVVMIVVCSVGLAWSTGLIAGLFLEFIPASWVGWNAILIPFSTFFVLVPYCAASAFMALISLLAFRDKRSVASLVLGLAGFATALYAGFLVAVAGLGSIPI